jgi:hypothetical protein
LVKWIQVDESQDKCANTASPGCLFCRLGSFLPVSNPTSAAVAADAATAAAAAADGVAELQVSLEAAPHLVCLPALESLGLYVRGAPWTLVLQQLRLLASPRIMMSHDTLKNIGSSVCRVWQAC